MLEEEIMEAKNTTHFGFETVPVEEKEIRVAGVFNSVAKKYDLMNDIISLGGHRLLKRITVGTSGVRQGNNILDLAGGTGDLTKLFSRKVGPKGAVFLCDINHSMLEAGRERLMNSGVAGNVQFVHANAENLPFSDNFFNCVTIGYGIRNFTNKITTLAEIERVLIPGGRLLILEFSTPTNPLASKAAELYSSLWPMFGKVLVGDSAPYKYLVESIQMHPNQETLKGLIENSGLSQVKYTNFFGGICALHRAVKL